MIIDYTAVLVMVIILMMLIINADDTGEDPIFRRREVLLRNGLSAI